MEQVIAYLKQTYNPLSILVYGSFADGSHSANSDFDALVISESHPPFHDVSFVNGIQLDVFVYPRSCFEADVNYENFIQLFDCRIAADTEDIGRKLKDGVLSYLAGLPKKSPEEIRSDTAWCRKMLLRTRRGDAEGMFRWHWLLVDSLEIFCGMAGHPYFGPKKSLRWMKQEHPEAYTLYTDALTHFEFQAAERWVDFLERSLDSFLRICEKNA